MHEDDFDAPPDPRLAPDAQALRQPLRRLIIDRLEGRDVSEIFARDEEAARFGLSKPTIEHLGRERMESILQRLLVFRKLSPGQKQELNKDYDEAVSSSG